MLPLVLTQHCTGTVEDKQISAWTPLQPAWSPNPAPWKWHSLPLFAGLWEIDKYLRIETAWLQVCIQIKGTQLEKLPLRQLWR